MVYCYNILYKPTVISECSIIAPLLYKNCSDYPCGIFHVSRISFAIIVVAPFLGLKTLQGVCSTTDGQLGLNKNSQSEIECTRNGLHQNIYVTFLS